MAERSLRGSRLGALSMETDHNVVPSERNITTYLCPNGHSIELPFSVEADVPHTWECRCGEDAKLQGGGPPPAPAPYWTRPPYGFLWMLALVSIAVALGVYPIVRRLTQRLETLQRGCSAGAMANFLPGVPRRPGSPHRAAEALSGEVGVHRVIR